METIIQRKLFVLSKCFLAFRVDTKRKFCFLVICVLVYLEDYYASGYNLDLESATIQSGDTGSMFGFDVALHQDQDAKWLLIGAPRAQTSQPGITRGGAVYRCPVENNVCQPIPFDTSGNDILYNGTHYRDVEDKSNQFFGATVVSGQNGIIVACAPSYVYFSTRLDKREPVGACYLARTSSRDYVKYSPCRTLNLGYHRQGYCQAGFSVAISQQGKQLLIGAVGSWYWQGQLFNYNFEEGLGSFTDTKEGPATDDDTYMGYSSAVGRFDEDELDDYAVGRPRAEHLLGKVIMFTQNLTEIAFITGDQMGSYFGYSVAVQDLNGDGLHDIVIGAPLFSDFKSDESFETGRVYIYYQNGKHKFRRKARDILDGHHHRSRFGLSLAGIGDIDYDGYFDLAVGAPYGGKDGRGAVYIYHGSVEGIITDVQQVIEAEAALVGLTTFGWSLSGGIDMDDNRYPDLLIGAQNSAKAIFLRSRPVVRVAASLRIDPMNITLDHRTCTLIDGTKVTCITVYTCISYTGIEVSKELQFDISWRLDSSRNLSSRVYYVQAEFMHEESNTIKLQRDDKWCTTSFAYLQDNIRDKLTPITVDFTYDLHEKKSRRRRRVSPILNQRIPTTVRAVAQILKECGKDNVCIPELGVTALPVSDSHILGELEKLDILVLIENRGEDAYEAMLVIYLPPGAKYNQITNKKYVIPVFCDTDKKNASLVVCDLGNPLPKGAKTNFTLLVNPADVNGTTPSLLFELKVNSSNPENSTDLGNNMAVVDIPVKQAADIAIGGQSKPEQFIYTTRKAELYKETELVGPEIEHAYVVSNLGPSGMQSSIVTITWPSTDEGGHKLVNITDIIYDTRKVKCTLNNSSVIHYKEGSGSDVTVIQQQKLMASKQEGTRSKRDVDKRSNLKKFECGEGMGCSFINCTLGFLHDDESVEIRIKAKIWTPTLLKKRIRDPFYILSQGVARVASMPYRDLKIAPYTKTIAMYVVDTYVNPEKLIPPPSGIEPWIIGVSVSAVWIFQKKEKRRHDASREKRYKWKNSFDLKY
ncbi:hypothetical protein CHS0354_012112 [Potamilus streckersoni]|uniref:Integrin alpha-2 domain-containing protein n=1 Tax=Potamilus streckersoni TaxID=2493646 RepID=A0AAE0SAE3_9BIVA|nr:hypothetical protein CHS0354_012112 [Potamilus streckersoni]